MKPKPPPTPWDCPRREDWLVHADRLYEMGAEERGGELRRRWLQALRFAEGLRLRPKLVLVAGGWHTSAVNVTPSVCVEPHAALWRDRRHLRWWTPLYYATAVTGSRADAAVVVQRWGATPLDFPGMTDDTSSRNQLLRRFYWKAAYDVGVSYRAGRVWVRRGKKETPLS